MRTIPIVFSLAAILWQAHGQGSTQFTAQLTGNAEIPPNASPYSASASFFIVDGTLTLGGRVDLPLPSFWPVEAYLRGPAQPGSLGNLIYTFPPPQFSPPYMGRGGGHIYGMLGDELTLDATMLSDLRAGLWYVEITSAAYPNGEIRGQIVPVPEPSVFALLCLSGLALWVFAQSRQLR